MRPSPRRRRLADLLGPTRVALSRAAPASLALLPRAREAGPHARCRLPWPYSRGPGRPAPTRGAGLLGLTPARPGAPQPSEVPASSALLPRPRRASCSLTRSFFLPPVAALGPDLAPLLAPSSPARRSGLATPPGKAPRFSVLHDPPRGRAKKGRLGWHPRPVFFYPPPNAHRREYPLPTCPTRYRREAASKIPTRRPLPADARGDRIGPGSVIWSCQCCSRPCQRERSVARLEPRLVHCSSLSPGGGAQRRMSLHQTYVTGQPRPSGPRCTGSQK